MHIFGSVNMIHINFTKVYVYGLMDGNHEVLLMTLKET